MKRSGVADLPLHGGRVPQWLAERMTRLGTAITEAIVLDYGSSAFLSRLSDPFWFQAFGAVMGMDWHSSGITTSVMGALKRGLAPRADELGHLHLRRTRAVFTQHAAGVARDRGAPRVRWRSSRSHQPSHRAHRQQCDRRWFSDLPAQFCRTAQGEWAVVQQGLNDSSGMARRYHWHSAAVRDFVAEPHTGIVGDNQGTIMNLVDCEAESCASGAAGDCSRESGNNPQCRAPPADAGPS